MTLFDVDPPLGPVATRVPALSALEVDFPSVMIGKVAEQESWRKEIHRPATHTHKWWAQRLGSVFRGILTSAVASSAEEAEDLYGSATRLEGLVVLDPFAGSGTTLVEAAKLGASVIGFDINPVATLVQRQALARWDERGLMDAYNDVERASCHAIDSLHVGVRGESVLYYFWVAIAACPECGDEVELFSDYVFAKHAYWRKHPQAWATCPDCHHVVEVNLNSDEKLSCRQCGRMSDLVGPVSGQKMMCRGARRSSRRCPLRAHTDIQALR